MTSDVREINLPESELLDKVVGFSLKGRLTKKRAGSFSTHIIWQAQKRTSQGGLLKAKYESGRYAMGDGNYFTIEHNGRRVLYASDKSGGDLGDDVKLTGSDVPPTIPFRGLGEVFVHEYHPGSWQEEIK